jgi:hypothetical protein
MHRATLATASSGFLTKKFGHDLAGRDTFGESVNVITVGGGDVIILAKASFDDTWRREGREEREYWLGLAWFEIDSWWRAFNKQQQEL